jgi:hypothetical protein
MSIATLAWIAPSTTNTGGKTSENRSMRTAGVGTSLLKKVWPSINAEITGSKLTEDKGEAMVGAALSSKLRPLKAKPETQIKMLSKKAMVGTALLSKFCPNKAILHKYKKGTRRTERATIPWGCHIANLQRPKRDSIVKNINKNTQESKRTFQSTKQTRPQRGQRPSAQSDKDKKNIQTYIGAITMKDNIWTLLVTAYAQDYAH